MPTIECNNDEPECGCEIDVDLKTLECESNGSSGSHTTSYTYTGTVICPECEYENEVEFITEELDDTREILSCESA
ncbi:hypothetical protein QPK77_08125 [Providencia rettgeri]|nr:hypothetical protein [Providencia rettgeri]MDK3007907.1 hypothetical protein [Providencia rettgeri]